MRICHLFPVKEFPSSSRVRNRSDVLEHAQYTLSYSSFEVHQFYLSAQSQTLRAVPASRQLAGKSRDFSGRSDSRLGAAGSQKLLGNKAWKPWGPVLAIAGVLQLQHLQAKVPARLSDFSLLTPSIWKRKKRGFSHKGCGEGFPFNFPVILCVFEVLCLVTVEDCCLYFEYSQIFHYVADQALIFSSVLQNGFSVHKESRSF